MMEFTMFLIFSSLAWIKSTEENFLPIFNLKSGFYNGDSIKVEISNEDPEAVIYYTLDGSNPTENSKIYTNFIILKDKSFEDNFYSNKTTNVHSIEITFLKKKLKRLI